MSINNNVRFSANAILNGHRPPGVAGGIRGPSSGSGMPDSSVNSLIEMKLFQTVTFLSNASTRASNLNTSLGNLQSAFNPRTAVSGNTDLLRITSFSGQNLTDTSILIHQVATTQVNEGEPLTSNRIITATGEHEFEMEVDGVTHRLTFVVQSETNQRQFQQQVADTINNANLGVTASVTVNGANSTLRLETGTTGPGMDGGPRFFIRDVNGEAVALTGVGEITQAAGNAIFSVNGGAKQTNATNRVDLGNGLVVTLVAPSDEPVGIFMGQDRLMMETSVRQVVNQFNSLLETALLNSGDRNTRMLIREIQNVARFNRRDLESVGIRVSNDGFLTIDERAMNTAIENGSLDWFFRGTADRGPNAFVVSLGRLSENVANNPMRHVSPHASRLPGFNAAMAAVNRPAQAQGAGANQPNSPPSPFDALLPDDLMSFLFDALS